MRDLLVLIIHLVTTVFGLAARRSRAVVAESVLVKHQLLILNRSSTVAESLDVASSKFGQNPGSFPELAPFAFGLQKRI
jgi:hypothetical protein